MASSWDEPGAMIKTRSKTFSTLITSVTRTTASTGASSGTGDPPEHLPLGRTVDPGRLEDVRGGVAARPAAISTIANPAQIQT